MPAAACKAGGQRHESYSQAVRNGAWAGVGFYLITAVTLLTLSMSYDNVHARPNSRDVPVSLIEHIGHALPTLVHG